MKGRCQSGFMLVAGLVFLALLALLAAGSAAEATMELAKTGALSARQRAAAAADAGLARMLEGGAPTTAPIAAGGATADGGSWSGSVEYLGLAAAPGAGGLAAWHFRARVEGRAERGAAATRVRQFYVPAPPPADAALCMDPGCEVPPLCAVADGCDPPIRAVPVPLGWHAPAESP